jgi:hypothetical protein
MVARLGSGLLPLRVAHSLSDGIQGGVPGACCAGGMLCWGICSWSPGWSSSPWGGERPLAVAGAQPGVEYLDRIIESVGVRRYRRAPDRRRPRGAGQRVERRDGELRLGQR